MFFVNRESGIVNNPTVVAGREMVAPELSVCELSTCLRCRLPIAGFKIREICGNTHEN